MSQGGSQLDPLVLQVLRLATACLAGEATSEEAAELDGLLREHATARQAYLRFMADSNELRSWALEYEPADAAGEAEGLATFPKVLEETPLPPHIATRRRSRGHASAALPAVRLLRRHRVAFLGSAAALTLLFWVMFFSFIWPHLPGANPSEPLPTYAAQVTGQREPHWVEGRRPLEIGLVLNAGRTIELRAGFLEITFVDGAVVVLEGPARFRIDSNHSGMLESGRLAAKLTSPEAEGFFSVSTPRAQIIDLGTEFGVETSAVGATEVEVFEGMVEASPLPGPDVQKVTPLRVTAGQAATLEVGAGQFIPRPAAPGQFVQKLPGHDESLPLRTITPVAAQSACEYQYPNNPPERLIDGSGLTGGGSLAQLEHYGGTGFEGEPREAGDNACWGADSQVQPILLTFDLGAQYDIERIWLWNYSHRLLKGFLERGIGDFRIEISSDGENYQPLGAFHLQPAAALRTGAQSFAIHGRGRYIRLELFSFPEGIRQTGLGEVRFQGRLVVEPQPASSEGEERTPE